MINAVLFAFLILPSQEPLSVARWKCTPQKTMECSLLGCEEGKPTIWIVIDRDRKTYSRCDATGCEAYGADVTQSGIFTIYELRGRATFLKMSNTFGHFVDVATSGVSAFINGGRCEAQR